MEGMARWTVFGNRAGGGLFIIYCQGVLILWSDMFSRLYSQYAMVVVLAGLCGLFSVLTWTEQAQHGAAGGQAVARDLAQLHKPGRFLVVVRAADEDRAFAKAVAQVLGESGWTSAGTVSGSPADAKNKLLELDKVASPLDVIVCTADTAAWTVLDDVAQKYPHLGSPEVALPRSHSWPTFLTWTNVLNIAHQISTLAILAIGMTLVIISGGIDLSVGSLVAFAAVLATWLIREYAGAES